MSAIEISQIVKSPIRYSICTLVNDREEYSGMVNSFKQAGFTEPACEYLFIDNSERNQFDAYRGLNHFITLAKGEYIILCHQDIELRFDKLEVLEKRIAEINQLDPDWAILSNAGGYNLKKVFKRISHPTDQFNAGPFPHKVSSVDENFILIKKSANLSISRNLTGFHLYGTDICIIANILGYNAWVIDFHLYHKSTGNMNQSFFDTRKNLTKKYHVAFRSRYIKTTCTNLFISGNNTLNGIMNTALMISLTKFFLKIRKLVKGDYL